MSSIIARRCTALAIGFCCSVGVPAWGEPLALRFGIMPYASSSELVQTFSHLQDHLEAELDVRVELVAAPDYAAFVQHLLTKSYDFVFTAPHLALLAMERAQWRPLVSTARELRPIIVVRRDSPLHTLADLRGRTVATPDRMALVTLIVESELAQAHLMPGQDLTIQHASTHDNAMLLVTRGLADAGVTARALLERTAPPVRGSLRVLHEYPAEFQVVYMASPALSDGLREALRARLLGLRETESGRLFLDRLGGPVYLPLDEAGLRRYGALLPLLQARLQEASAR